MDGMQNEFQAMGVNVRAMGDAHKECFGYGNLIQPEYQEIIGSIDEEKRFEADELVSQRQKVTNGCPTLKSWFLD